MARHRNFTRIRVYDDGTVTSDKPYAWVFWFLLVVIALRVIGFAVVALAKLAVALLAIYVGFRLIGAVYRVVTRG